MQELYVKRNPLYSYFLLVQDGKRPHKPFHKHLYATHSTKRVSSFITTCVDKNTQRKVIVINALLLL